jgi:hypothetical protein
MNNFSNAEECMDFYKKSASNFAVIKKVEYFVALLNKFIEFEIKETNIFTLERHILKIEKEYEFSEEQKLFFNETKEEIKKK